PGRGSPPAFPLRRQPPLAYPRGGLPPFRRMAPCRRADTGAVRAPVLPAWRRLAAALRKRALPAISPPAHLSFPAAAEPGSKAAARTAREAREGSPVQRRGDALGAAGFPDRPVRARRSARNAGARVSEYLQPDMAAP